MEREVPGPHEGAVMHTPTWRPRRSVRCGGSAWVVPGRQRKRVFGAARHRWLVNGAVRAPAGRAGGWQRLCARRPSLRRHRRGGIDRPGPPLHDRPFRRWLHPCSSAHPPSAAPSSANGARPASRGGSSDTSPPTSAKPSHSRPPSPNSLRCSSLATGDRPTCRRFYARSQFAGQARHAAVSRRVRWSSGCFVSSDLGIPACRSSSLTGIWTAAPESSPQRRSPTAPVQGMAVAYVLMQAKARIMPSA